MDMDREADNPMYDVSDEELGDGKIKKPKLPQKITTNNQQNHQKDNPVIFILSFPSNDLRKLAHYIKKLLSPIRCARLEIMMSSFAFRGYFKLLIQNIKTD